MANPFVIAVEAAWGALKADLEAAEATIIGIVKQLWAADVQIIMNDLNKALTGYAQQLQNENPGISSEQLFAQLGIAVATEFVELGAQLVYADIMLVIAIVVKGSGAPANQGNNGSSPSGNFA